MDRRRFLAFLGCAFFVPKALKSLVRVETITPPVSTFVVGTPAPLTFNGVPIIMDAMTPPGTVYLLDSKRLYTEVPWEQDL